MESQNLLKKYPIKISLFYEKVGESILKDKAFIEMINILSEKDNTHKYEYCIYTDINMLKNNIFIPIFNTLYLGCSRHNVVISNSKDCWILDVFPNNNYFLIKNDDDVFDTNIYSSIKIIDSLLEIT